MIQNFKVYIIIAVVSAAIGGYGVYRLRPAQIQQVEVEKVITRTDTKVVTKVIERPDGTKETTIEATDKSVKKDEQSKQVTVAQVPKYHVSLIASTPIDKFELNKPTYTLLVQKDFIGPFSLGASYSTDNKIGLSIGFNF